MPRKIARQKRVEWMEQNFTFPQSQQLVEEMGFNVLAHSSRRSSTFFTFFDSPLEPLSTEPLIQKHQHWKLSQHKTSVLEGEKFNISDLEEAGHFPLILMGNENVGCSRFIGVEMLSLHELRWETRVSERKCEENLRKLSQYLKISVNGMDGWEWVWMVGIR